MKNCCFILALLLAGCLLMTCKKLQEAPQTANTGTATKTTTSDGDTTAGTPIIINPSLLAGTWQVINDTLTTVPWGLWQGRPISTSNYVGTPADYYTFTANGNAYTRLNNVIDTANYTVSQDTIHMIYTYFNGQEQTGGIYNSFWTVTNLTAHTAAVSVTFVTPETAITSVVNLKR